MPNERSDFKADREHVIESVVQMHVGDVREHVCRCGHAVANESEHAEHIAKEIEEALKIHDQEFSREMQEEFNRLEGEVASLQGRLERIRDALY